MYPYEKLDEATMTFFNFNHKLNAQKTSIINPQRHFLGNA